MSITTITSRHFNQDVGYAKRAAEKGPVFITDRGRPSHVLLSFEQYMKILGQNPDILELGILLMERRDKEQGKILRLLFDRQVIPAFSQRITEMEQA
ncbi:prevent-host-death family protein [Desulfosarcina variabilis str. Montpellier]|uniref:type II toxin-antitoxin system Phd/YefM family antitoxin n=1 Tax=Desulfosarcina variabilis TaxID=2300 RepID=UPI003AFB3C81